MILKNISFFTHSFDTDIKIRIFAPHVMSIIKI